MRPALRWSFGLTGLVTAAAAWWPTDDPAQPVAAATASSSPTPTAATLMPSARAAQPSPDVSRPAATRTAWPALERASAWVPPAPTPPPPPPAPAAPPPAPPPAFPLQWLGQLQDGDGLRIFLADARRTLAVAPGETVDGQWRFEGLSEGRLQWTWLATGEPVLVEPRP